MEISPLPPVKTRKKDTEARMAQPLTRTPIWCLEVVLRALRQPPYYPLIQGCKDYEKLLSRRTVSLTAVTSARRANELHALEHPLDFIALTCISGPTWISSSRSTPTGAGAANSGTFHGWG